LDPRWLAASQWCAAFLIVAAVAAWAAAVFWVPWADDKNPTTGQVWPLWTGRHTYYITLGGYGLMGLAFVSTVLSYAFWSAFGLPWSRKGPTSTLKDPAKP
jgi:hypothetical protein